MSVRLAGAEMDFARAITVIWLRPLAPWYISVYDNSDRRLHNGTYNTPPRLPLIPENQPLKKCTVLCITYYMAMDTFAVSTTM